MKKLFALILALASFSFAGSLTESNASTMARAGKPQVRIQIGRPRRRDRDRDWRDRNRDGRENRGDRVGYGYGRTEVQTRLVQSGWHTYRETYQVRYLPDGRTQTTLISRVRVN
ncbi:MAG TPA: hypothetical protein VK582_17745 [Pyrinomonadaceae bacterium]|nr:hypothetical protein [Pyrinomonadaceae bacterium]